MTAAATRPSVTPQIKAAGHAKEEHFRAPFGQTTPETKAAGHAKEEHFRAPFGQTTPETKAAGPLTGLRVVEVAVGTSELGLGLAGGVPGRLLADLGADVVRVVGQTSPGIDADVPWGEAWHRDKRIVGTDDAEPVRALLAEADAALVYGPEALVEGRGLGHLDLRAANPGLVYARCRPSRTSTGAVEDYGLLVEARSGFCTQLAGHRPGPIFVDVRAPGIGTAALLTASVLALLRRRATTGGGGWVETSLYDGMLATLGCMIGRSERARPEIEGYWELGSTFPNFLYRCADGELIQVWFGGKGMYAKLIEVLGDEPSVEGYYTDQATGKLQDRAKRWRAPFALRPRDVWIERLREAGVACEPVLGPGEALRDPHLAEIGLAVARDHDGHPEVMLGSPIAVGPLPRPETPAGPWTQERPVARAAAGTPPGDGSADANLNAANLNAAGDTAANDADDGVANDAAAGNAAPLRGVRVVDFSAFVAGPLAAQVLADLGAEVIKVEPPEGEAMRAAAYAVAACQRGKRSIAIDITAPEARPVVERLIRWADVVLHNFRVGVAERLGIGAADVARLNPRAVYSHASAFGPTGPRAKQPGNDALMQAVTGLERAIGGDGNEPIAATWIPIDVTGGWVAAAGILAGLYAQAVRSEGQQVATSLLGAGMLLQSGSFLRDGSLVAGPALDQEQTGYGPGYRLYQAGDGEWFALVLPDERSWTRLRAVLAGGEPPPAGGRLATYAPLRGGAHDTAAREAETLLEKAFAGGTAAAWVARLRAEGLLAELVRPTSRDDFRRGILDDPLNRQLGRVAAYEVADWGHFEQIGPLPRLGQPPSGGPTLALPGIGEHSIAILSDLGLPAQDVDALLAAKIVRQL
ncbi:CoA transferase [Pseudofrankia sp. BMG5.37]|uniref:CoA transferase n=1 Tax=Pseudofrankia sp. BMG5.37 TaxID=3050035 RepID=UPI00289467EA|nr:CoA transferase [Pseudofrankia sp. BMG5.37]MDT3443277.1 CoA transferase [Pseudofrankia sp. BMG5.37]